MSRLSDLFEKSQPAPEPAEEDRVGARSSCLACRAEQPSEPMCLKCSHNKVLANITRIEVVCYGCFGYPTTLLDRAGRPWCQSCADESLYCLSCGESRREVGRQTVGNVEVCNRCAGKVAPEECLT